MNEIASEYGSALFMLAVENNQPRPYMEALDTIADAFLENPDYFTFLQSPAVSKNERLASIEAVFRDALPKNVLFFLMLLCEKGRLSFFFDIHASYRALLDASEHIANAKITSAVALTEDEKEKLQKKLVKLCRCDVISTYEIDETILGGVIIEVDGSVIDGSLRHRLSEIKGVMNT